jgi:uncharacterized membrane-anchored protein
MVKRFELEAILATIEKRRIAIESKRTFFQFEAAFFIPLLALLFLVSYFSQSNAVKMGFYVLTIVLIVADLVYSVLVYRDLTDKQKNLEKLIHKKISGD